jgi:hypothetical protein
VKSDAHESRRENQAHTETKSVPNLNCKIHLSLLSGEHTSYCGVFDTGLRGRLVHANPTYGVQNYLIFFKGHFPLGIKTVVWNKATDGTELSFVTNCATRVVLVAKIGHFFYLPL